MPKISDIRFEVPLPDGVTASIDGDLLTVRGPLGTVSRDMRHPRISKSVEDGAVVLAIGLPRKKERALIGTWEAHVANMVHGVREGFRYRLRIRYSHFPMKVLVKGDTIVIENFMGERHPRTAAIVEGTKVEVKGEEVLVSGIDVERTGQTAANLELATVIRNYDPKVFQDGIYIVEMG